MLTPNNFVEYLSMGTYSDASVVAQINKPVKKQHAIGEGSNYTSTVRSAGIHS